MLPGLICARRNQRITGERLHCKSSQSRLSVANRLSSPRKPAAPPSLRSRHSGRSGKGTISLRETKTARVTWIYRRLGFCDGPFAFEGWKAAEIFRAAPDAPRGPTEEMSIEGKAGEGKRVKAVAEQVVNERLLRYIARGQLYMQTIEIQNA